MPASWRKEDAEIWGKVPRDVQAKIKSREDEREVYVNRIKSEHDTSTRYVRDVAEAIKPHDGLLRSLNVNPIQAIGAVMNDAAIAYIGTPQQKRDLVMRVMQTSGLTPQDLLDNGAEAGQPTGNGQGSSAELQALQARLRVAEAQRLEIEQQFSQREVGIRRTQLASTVSELMAEKGADGKPIRPFFEKLQDSIALYAKSMADAEKARGIEPDYRPILDLAYTLAEAKSPDVQNMKKAEAAELERRKKEEAERLAKAKAMSTPKASGAVGASVNGNKNKPFKELLTGYIRGET